MELVTKKRLHLLAGRSHLPLAEEIADHLGVELGQPNLAEFANGEIHCRFGEIVRGTDVFIIQTHGATPELSVNDAIMEQLIMIDAAQRASAKRITAVIPLLRLRPPGPQGRGPRADHRQAGGRHVHGGRAPTGWCRSTCTPARSRASSTARSTTSPPCRCWSTTSATTCPRTSWSCRPTPAG